VFPCDLLCTLFKRASHEYRTQEKGGEPEGSNP
jgi:hypothetical protein